MDVELGIALSSYNAGPWLGELFQSIENQDYTGWRIVARDDGSKDNSVAVLLEWQKRLRDRMVLIQDGKGNLGGRGNYTAIFEHTTAPYIMFADGDDVWLPGKISASIEAMRAAEQSIGNDKPILICGNAIVVDNQLKVIAPSYWRWSRHNPDLLNSFSRMIAESPALCSTILVNRALLNLALPLPGEGKCPLDWWNSIVACAFGRVVYLRDATIMYRRHPTNESTAPVTATLKGIFSLSKGRERVNHLVKRHAIQASEFLMRFEEQLTPREIAALRAVIDIPSLNFFQRRVAFFRHNLWLASPLKNLGLMLLL